MSSRLDLCVRKYPDHEDAIRQLASRDPSGNLKYLDWSAKVLASGQALAGEIADVVELFHVHGPRGAMPAVGVRQRKRVRALQLRPDLYSYRPADLAHLRDVLLKIKRLKEKKQRQREKLYKLEGEADYEVVFEDDDIIVRHVRNKPASMHYGLGTKWCISMKQAGYFEEYESTNATFFFVERKKKKNDPFDKVAVMVPRGPNGEVFRIECFNSLDQMVDMFQMAIVFGDQMFAVFSSIAQRSRTYPGSLMSQVYRGVASLPGLEAAFVSVLKRKDMHAHEVSAFLEAVCCNDAADEKMLERVFGSVRALLQRTRKKRGRRRRMRNGLDGYVGETERTVAAAAYIHPAVGDEERKRIGVLLRRRKVKLDTIRRVVDPDGKIGVTFDRAGQLPGLGPHALRAFGRRRRARRMFSLTGLRRRAVVYANMAKRAKEQLAKGLKLRKEKAKKAAKKKAMVRGKTARRR